MAVHNFDMGAFYTKWLRDIRDSQLFHEAEAGTLTLTLTLTQLFHEAEAGRCCCDDCTTGSCCCC